MLHDLICGHAPEANMMKHMIHRATIVLGFALLVADVACAASSVDMPPPPLRDKHPHLEQVFREYEVRSFVEGRPTDLTCNIRFVDPFFGYLNLDEYGLRHKAAVSVRCYEASDTLVNTAWAQPDGRGGWKLKGYEDQLDVMRFYALESINAKGWAVTEEDKIGDEAGRAKRLHYCLVREQKALCGHGDMGYVQDIRRHPQNDLTNYTLRILRSIEFVDEPAAAVAASAPAASAAASAP